MELLIGCLVVAAIVQHVPGAIQDLIVAWRASKAGEWDVIDRQQARRDAQADKRAARRQALAEKLAARRGRAGDPERRPGVGDIVRDVYHGMCEDALEKRRTKRAGQPPTATQRRVDERLQGEADRTVPDNLPRHCPECGQELVWQGNAWVHAHGHTCPAARSTPEAPRRPSPRPRPTAGPVRPTGSGVPEPAKPRWRCNRCGEESPDRGDAMANYTNHKCPVPDVEPTRRPAPDDDNVRPVTAADLDVWGDYMNGPDPTPTHGPPVYGDHASPDQPPGGTMTTAEEVQTNEAARRNFQKMKEGAAELAEAAAAAEAARAKLAAAAQANADGMAGGGFDAGAAGAAAEAVDAIDTGTLSRWCEVADAAGGAADRGLAALEKYRDAEDVVASNNVDGRTLEPSQS